MYYISNVYTFAVTILFQFWLLEIRVTFHLVYGWDNFSCLEQVIGLGDAEVGDSNCFGEALCNQIFHGLTACTIPFIDYIVSKT